MITLGQERVHQLVMVLTLICLKLAVDPRALNLVLAAQFEYFLNGLIRKVVNEATAKRLLILFWQNDRGFNLAKLLKIGSELVKGKIMRQATDKDRAIPGVIKVNLRPIRRFAAVFTHLS